MFLLDWTEFAQVVKMLSEKGMDLQCYHILFPQEVRLKIYTFKYKSGTELLKTQRTTAVGVLLIFIFNYCGWMQGYYRFQFQVFCCRLIKGYPFQKMWSYLNRYSGQFTLNWLRWSLSPSCLLGFSFTATALKYKRIDQLERNEDIKKKTCCQFFFFLLFFKAVMFKVRRDEREQV